MGCLSSVLLAFSQGLLQTHLQMAIRNYIEIGSYRTPAEGLTGIRIRRWLKNLSPVVVCPTRCLYHKHSIQGFSDFWSFSGA